MQPDGDLAQTSAPEDGRNYRPKHIELIEIINNLLLHLVGCLYCNIFSTLSYKQHGLKKIIQQHKMCVLLLSTTSSQNIFILTRIQ